MRNEIRPTLTGFLPGFGRHRRSAMLFWLWLIFVISSNPKIRRSAPMTFSQLIQIT